MTVSFEGFPRTLERSALRPGRWFVAAEGARPLLCLVTGVEADNDLVAITFGTSAVEVVQFGVTRLAALEGPFGTVEDEIVFSPGLTEGRPTLTPPVRRAFRAGSLLRLRNGDLGVGFGVEPQGLLAIVSLQTGQRAEGFDLVFERWSLSLRRGGAETLLGFFKPLASVVERRRGVDR
jgi:hypothetical protein